MVIIVEIHRCVNLQIVVGGCTHVIPEGARAMLFVLGAGGNTFSHAHLEDINFAALRPGL